MRRIRRRNAGLNGSERRGATLVELSVVLPVFFAMVFAFIEFGHVFMTIHVLNGAAKQAARVGVGDNSSTQKVKDRANQILGSMLSASNYTVEVLDGSVFDDPDVDPATIDYEDLDDVEVGDADPRQLYIVRVTVPYSSVAILGPRWLPDLTLTGQSVIRHE